MCVCVCVLVFYFDQEADEVVVASVDAAFVEAGLVFWQPEGLYVCVCVCLYV